MQPVFPPAVGGKQFCAVCFLGEAWENNMKMISFSLQQAYLMLAGKHRNKGKVEAFVFLWPLPSCLFFFYFYFFYTRVSAFFHRFSTVTENIKRSSGVVDELFQRKLMDIRAVEERTRMHTDTLTLRSLASNSHGCWRWTEHTKRVE